MQKVSMLQRLSGKWRLWGEALAGMDDPLGEYLLELEERLGRLEGEMEQLRQPLSANPTAERIAAPKAKDLR